MSIDLSALVLGPCMDTFSKSVVVIPVSSDELGAPYTARGVWIIDNINIMTENDASFSSRVIKFGIKLDEFAIPPQKYDFITVKVTDLPLGYKVDSLDPNATVDFVIDNDQPDGQGGSVLILKRQKR